MIDRELTSYLLQLVYALVRLLPTMLRCIVRKPRIEISRGVSSSARCAGLSRERYEPVTTRKRISLRKIPLRVISCLRGSVPDNRKIDKGPLAPRLQGAFSCSECSWPSSSKSEMSARGICHMRRQKLGLTVIIFLWCASVR